MATHTIDRLVDANGNEFVFSDSSKAEAGTASPLMDGKASVGNSLKYAREDHIHPSDTSREDIANKTTVVLGTSDSKYPTDKAVAEFVNSSIATNTANYISNNGEPFTSVEQLEAYTGTVTNNDYAFVTGIDSEGNTYYDRYKATVSGSTVTWALEYRLNNSSFTAAQWSAINSGITSVLVAKIHDHSNKDVLDGITSDKVNSWDGKEDAFSVLPTTKGGTGTNAASKSALTSSLINSLSTGASKPVDADYYVSQYKNGGTSNTSFLRKPVSALWEYIKDKISSVLRLTASDYAGKAATAGTADKAVADNSGNNIEETYSTKTELSTHTSDTTVHITAAERTAWNNKLNVDGSNATNEGVTAMMRKVPSGTSTLSDKSSYFGDSDSDHAKIVRRPVLDIWNYVKGKLGSAGSKDRPVYFDGGVPKECDTVLPCSIIDSGSETGYGVYVGGNSAVGSYTRCNCSFLLTASATSDLVAHTYIGTFTFRHGSVLNYELKCLTGTPNYPMRIAVSYNKNSDSTYNLGVYVIPADPTENTYANYKLTSIASSAFTWACTAINAAECAALDNDGAKPALVPIRLYFFGGGSNVDTTGGSWIPTFNKGTINKCRGIVDLSVKVDLSVINQTTYVGDLATYTITLVNSSGTDILSESLHQKGIMPRQTKSSTGGGTVDISNTHRFVFPITASSNLFAGYRPKITLPTNYPLDSNARVSILAICSGIVHPYYGKDTSF